jgi:hypothetical protein
MLAAVGVLLATVITGAGPAHAADDCASRDPFTTDFEHAWHDVYGAPEFAAFVEDRVTGCTYGFGDSSAIFPLASSSKVLVMAGALVGVQNGAWTLDAIAPQLYPMIHVSDDDATAQLLQVLNPTYGIAVMAQRFGLASAYVRSAGAFGSTSVTAADAVELVDKVIASDPSPLTDPALRGLAHDLTEGVDPSQKWGVSAGVPAGWHVSLKNGWYATLPGDIGPAGYWRVNSIGLVSDADGDERWSIAVLGNEWTTYTQGVNAIESISTRVADVLEPEPEAEAVAAPAMLPQPDGQPSGLVPIGPQRILDTRRAGGPRPAGATTRVSVAGIVPPEATAAVVHLTVDQPDADGFLTAYPCGQGVPLVSNVNYARGSPASDDAVVAVVDAEVCVYSSARTQLVVDVTGAYTPAAGLRFVPVPVPQRLVDTRTTAPVLDAGAVTVVTVPGSAGAALLNVTADAATDPGFLTAFPCGGGVPLTSTVNFPIGRPIAGEAVVPVAADGTVCVYASARVAVIVDLLGTYADNPAGLLFRTAVPARLLDTRDGTGGWLGVLGVGQTIDVATGLPAGTVAVGTLTAAGGGRRGFVTAWAGGGVPLASNLNHERGDVIPNLTAVAVAADGRFRLYSGSGGTHLLFDLAGWFAP